MPQTIFRDNLLINAMKWIRPLSLCLLTGALFFLLNWRYGPIPAPGKFLNPFAGFWQNSRSTDELPATLELSGLHETVRILWDDRHVPHIFARNVHDLFFAQGYCVARDRLWQMDFQARAAAGRLSEVLGARTLELDRFNRRIGLGVAAELVMRNHQADPFMHVATEAFGEGVNAWINDLEERHVPLEFKIFDYSPEMWTSLKSALIFSNFALTLSFSNNDAALTRARDILGDSLTSILYPDVLPFADPVIPKGTPWKFAPLPGGISSSRETPEHPSAITKTERFPGAGTMRGGLPDDGTMRGRSPDASTKMEWSPDSLTMMGESPEASSMTGGIPGTAAIAEGEVEEADLFIGSNNWALSGSRTASGRPILCSDPHLGLTLPSIWYEVQLTSPEINVYGVSTPGWPGVLIGFNKTIAFGETNAGSDVLDWYEITFKDSSLNEYLHAGLWHPTHKREEIISVRGGPAVVETVVYTHHGPVVARPGERLPDQRIPSGYAMRWTALDSSNAIDAFLKMNMTDSYDDFVRALHGYDCPAQNFVYADADNNIAIWHNGKLPLRRKDQGKFLLDGKDPADEWHGWVPRAHLPHVFNPAQGFVSSANQPPADSTYPYYLGWNYAGFERSTRINDRLRDAQKATIEDMKALQIDIVNPRAAKALPLLLSLVDGNSLRTEEAKAFTELQGWKYDYAPRLISPQVFEYWWREIETGVWQDDLRRDGVMLMQPRADVTLHLLLSDPGSQFVDDRTTSRVETLGEIVRNAFSVAVLQLTKEFGPFSDNWAWGKSRGTSIRHLAQIPGLGRSELPTSGNYNTVNAISRTGGPSWRMAVELGTSPVGWGVYPGGQSGSPGSVFYDNSVDTWMKGSYHQLVFLNDPNRNNDRIVGETEMRGSK